MATISRPKNMYFLQIPYTRFQLLEIITLEIMIINVKVRDDERWVRVLQ
jgi:hypothetical protein